MKHTPGPWKEARAYILGLSLSPELLPLGNIYEDICQAISKAEPTEE